MQSHLTGHRGVWHRYSPQGGLRWLDSGKPCRSRQPTSSFCVRLLVAESSGKWRGLGEKNGAETGLSHFTPSWTPNPRTKEAPTWHPGQEQKGPEAGEKRAAGWAWEGDGGAVPAGPNTPSLGRCLAWQLPGTQTRGLFDPCPALSGATSFIFLYCYFCPIGYRSVLHPVWFSIRGCPGSLWNRCVHCFQRSDAVGSVSLRLFSDQMGHRLLKKHPNL